MHITKSNSSSSKKRQQRAVAVAKRQSECEKCHSILRRQPNGIKGGGRRPASDRTFRVASQSHGEHVKRRGGETRGVVQMQKNKDTQAC